MARKLRYHLPGATYHVMLRGNDGQQIFFDEADICKMCLLIQEGVERFGHRILAYCFMNNHIHLAIQVGQISLSNIMQNLSFRYTQYINWRKERIGHLFQGRFKSILVDDGRYLKELVRYIHLNPVRAGLVARADHYRWSSHNGYLGTNDTVWLTPQHLLARFADCPSIAISKFQSYVDTGIANPEQPDFKHGMYEGIYGDDEFVKNVKERAALVTETTFRVPDIIQAACELYDIDLETLRKPGKTQKATHIRALLAFLVKETRNLTLEELGRILQRDASSLSKQAARLMSKGKSEESQKKVAELKRHLSQMPECQA